MFSLCNDDSVFSNLSANTPDVIAVNENHREVFILEVGCTFDYSLEEAFLTKMLKYHQLERTKLVVRGLQMAGLSRRRGQAVSKVLRLSRRRAKIIFGTSSKGW